MRSALRASALLCGASVLLGGDCVVGRPIVDERGRYYPSDGVISCTGTRCAELPAYELDLPPRQDSPCAGDLPEAELITAAQSGPSLSGMRYVLASERPRDVSLGAVDVRDACLVLSGPVRLTLAPGSTLTRVTVMLGRANPTDRDAGVRPSARATPNLYIGHAELDRVTLEQREEDEPSGSAQIEFSTCVQCETSIDVLNVTESQMQNSRLGAGSLTVVGGAFDTVELAFEYGLLAGVLANNMRTTACSTLSLVGATIAGRASRIGPCDCVLPPTAQPDAGEPGAREADAGTDAGESDASGLHAGTAEAGEGEARTDAGRSDAGTFDAGELDAEQSEAGKLDSGELDANTSDATVHVANEPEAGASDAGTADLADADAGYAEAGAQDATELEAGELDEGEIDAYEYDAGPGISACNGVTISRTLFLGGMIDGELHAENSTFHSVLFARHAPTALDMWNVDIELSVVCDQQMDIRLDRKSGIGCTSCDSAETATACRLDGAPDLIVNPCKSFRGKLAACEPPLPTRRTPYVPTPPRLGN